MADSDNERRWGLEGFVGRLSELTTVLGPDVAPVVERVQSEVAAGIAERDRGDIGAATARVATAMAELAALGDRVGPAEGAMMRALTAQFIDGMNRGDRERMETDLDRIQERTGRPKRPLD